MDTEDLMVFMDESIFDGQNQKQILEGEDNIENGYIEDGYSQEDLMSCMDDNIFAGQTNEQKLKLTKTMS